MYHDQNNKHNEESTKKNEKAMHSPTGELPLSFPPPSPLLIKEDDARVSSTLFWNNNYKQPKTWKTTETNIFLLPNLTHKKKSFK